MERELSVGIWKDLEDYVDQDLHFFYIKKCKKRLTAN